MNTRIVLRHLMRHLMRHRQTVFWSHRASCAVAIPLDLFPEQPPSAPPSAPAGYREVVLGWIGDPRDGCLSASSFTADPAFEDWHWQGAYCAVQPDGEVNTDERIDMPPADLLAHAQERIWCERWLQGAGDAERPDLLLSLNAARDYVATAYSEIRGTKAVITYSVKCDYRPRRNRFCSAIARALDLGAGRVRLVKP